MEKLSIAYGVPQGRKLLNLTIGVYLLFFCLFLCIIQFVANKQDTLFYASLIGILASAILVLSNTSFQPKSLLDIDNNTITSSIQSAKLIIEWVNVSRVNIGVSYIILFLGGGKKQQKIDLSTLMYKDVALVKAKIVELCEFKSIPYNND